MVAAHQVRLHAARRQPRAPHAARGPSSDSALAALEVWGRRLLELVTEADY